MGQNNCTTKKGEYKHFNEKERYRLEWYLEEKITVLEIAKKLKKDRVTIYREIKRGKVVKINSELKEYEVYRANVGQRDYEEKVKRRKRKLKIEKDKQLEEYIRKKLIKDKYAPDAIIGQIKRQGKKFKETICTKTLYNYIEEGIIEGISNESLWEKRKRSKKRYRKVRRVGLKNKTAKRIEERPEKANKREEYGHWEGDSIKGPKKKGKASLFTLTERKTREQIIMKLESGHQSEICKAMNSLEVRYGKGFKEKFKTITLDNGSEFLDYKSIERSNKRLGEKRTEVYYAHPYSAWERGSNENQNRMIRRFIHKGMSITSITEEYIKEIEDWINNYPRKILGYRSANELVFEVTKNRFTKLN